MNDFPLTLCKDHTQCCLRKLVDVGGSEKMVQFLRTAFQEPLVNPQEIPASGVLELTRRNSTISPELRVAIGSEDVTEIEPSNHSGQYLWARSAMYEWYCHNDRDQNKFLRVTVKRLDSTWISGRESLSVHFTAISNTASREKIISINICLDHETAYTPKISRALRCYNMVYYGSPVVEAVMQNDMGKLQQLFSAGEASPWDMIKHEENLLVVVWVSFYLPWSLADTCVSNLPTPVCMKLLYFFFNKAHLFEMSTCESLFSASHHFRLINAKLFV